MRSANIGRANNAPFRVIPEGGKILKNRGSSQSEVSPYVFQDCVAGS